MLQGLHSGAKKWIALPLFGLLILSFVVWGVADVFDGRVADATVIKAGAVEISGQQLEREVQNEMQFLQQLTGRAFTLKEAADLGFINRATQSMVERALLEQEAARLGIKMGDAAVLKTVQQIEQFKKPDGSFDVAAFRGALQRVGLTEQAFVADQRITMAREQLASVIGAAVSVPEPLARALAAATAEQRSFETYQVKFADQPKPAAPDDAVLAEFMNRNQQAYMAPEYRALNVLHISAAKVGQDISVTDADIADYYANHTADFNQPERRTLKQVVLPTEAEAQKIAASGTLPASATELNDVAQNDLPPELQTVAFELAAGKLSAPVQSPLGWHVLQVNAIQPARTVPLAEATDKIRTLLRAQKAGDLLVKETQAIDDLLAGGAPLAEIAGIHNLELQAIAATDAAGKTPAGEAVSASLAPREVLVAAFSLPQAEPSNIISTPTEDYYVVEVTSITPSALKPLAQIRPQVVADWQKQEQQQAAQAKATAIKTELQNGALMQDVAAKHGIETSLERGQSRASPPPNYLPAMALADIFRLKRGEVTSTITPEAVVVTRLTNITLPTSVAAAKPDTDLQDTLKQALQNETFAAYINALKQRYAVTVDEPAIAKLFAAAEE